MNVIATSSPVFSQFADRNMDRLLLAGGCNQPPPARDRRDFGQQGRVGGRRKRGGRLSIATTRSSPESLRFAKGSIHREDRLPVPAEALREIVINAFIHRDVSNPSSYVAIAVFDDRIEVRSIGDFPSGVRAEQLSREQLSVRRNPRIAEAFHRTGAIEAWGRGTNRVTKAGLAYGVPDPEFIDDAGAVTVTFKAEVVADLGRAPSQVGPKCSPSKSARNRIRIEQSPGADGPLWREEPDAVPRPNPRPAPLRRPRRKDDPRQAVELEAAISQHRGRASSPADGEAPITCTTPTMRGSGSADGIAP